MKLQQNQHAPAFSTRDVYGKELDLKKLQGQTLYLSFERNAGCPVCNLRTHELLKHSEFFRAHNITVIMVYESPVETMKAYLGENTYPFHFVADPENRLYGSYGVERSFTKVIRALWNGIMEKVAKGKKLFNQPMKQDGHLDRISAEFIIDKSGRISHLHYGRFVGDHLGLATLKSILAGV